MEILVTGILYVVYPVQKRHCIRSNSIWHMYYLEQNLLLSTNDNNLVLKIADFRFARSLQPRGLVETLCGSPLYMAPKIMQLQKYDAKSVGAILFQLVTGRTPFTGNNHIQLLQNIVKYSELHFPPDNNDLSADCKDLCQKLLRRNPVERLTFEEFFNHPFLSQKQPNEALSRRSSRIIDGFPLSECNSVRKTEASSQEDCMSFPLDDDSSGAEGSPSFLRKRSSMKSTYGFSPDKKVDIRETIFNTPNNMDLASKYSKVVQELWIHRRSWLIRIMFLYLDPQWMCHLPRLLLPSQKTGSSGFDGIFGYGRLKKWDQLGGQLMLQVLRIMKNYARQLNACLDLKVCSTTRKAQVGKWCMWIMRMMYFLLGMILRMSLLVVSAALEFCRLLKFSR
ncbi:unnamed protein product, partial [Vitis vinifera]